jgi:hypothetical protein
MESYDNSHISFTMFVCPAVFLQVTTLRTTELIFMKFNIGELY